MGFLIDTDVAIHWRDGSKDVRERIIGLGALPTISVLTRVELENGVYRDQTLMERRRRLLDNMLARLPILNFTDDTAAIYSAIIGGIGVSKRKIIDRMIAATAIENGMTLVTMNRTDFATIPGLVLETWPTPPA